MMSFLETSTIPEQVAEHLREGIFSGRWRDKMPGRDLLAAEIGVSPRSVQDARKILEKEGLLISRGSGRRHRILIPKGQAPPPLKIQILLHDQNATHDHYMVEMVHQLQKVGHSADFSSKTLADLKLDAKRVARYVKKIEADAWVVCAGSKSILDWFAQQSTPAFALFGRSENLAMASVKPDKVPADRRVIERLIQLGHRSIVRLAPQGRRKPFPGIVEQEFLDTLEAAGIETGAYNLPDWEQSREGVHQCLDSLFEQKPPTALVLDVAPLFFAAHQYLSQRGLRVPQDVSLVCSDPNPIFEWSNPPVSHIAWETSPLVRRIRSWANNVARGRADLRKSGTEAIFVEGGTIGPLAK